MGEELALLMSHRRASSVNSTFTLYMKPVIISRAALDLLDGKALQSGNAACDSGTKKGAFTPGGRNAHLWGHLAFACTAWGPSAPPHLRPAAPSAAGMRSLAAQLAAS